MKKQKKKITMDKKEKNMWLSLRNDIDKNLKTYTFLLTIMTFLMRGFWYFYSLGYFRSLKIDTSYLRVDDAGSLYNVMGFVGIAAIYLTINYVMYSVIERKHIINAIRIFIIEVVLLFWGICKIESIGIVELWKDIYNWKDAIKCVVSMILDVVLLNAYAIAYAAVSLFRTIIEGTVKSENKEQTKNKKRVKKQKRIKNNKKQNDSMERKIVNDKIWLLFSVILTTAFIGGVVYIVGRETGNDKIDYKIIEEKNPQNEVDVEEKYLFPSKDDNIVRRCYAVLYETNEEYITAALCINENKNVEIETGTQRVFSKENVTTVYYSNIQDDDLKKKN